MRRTLSAASAALAIGAAFAVSRAMAADDDGRDIAEVAAPDAGQAQVVVALKAGQAYRVEAICCSYEGGVRAAPREAGARTRGSRRASPGRAGR